MGVHHYNEPKMLLLMKRSLIVIMLLGFFACEDNSDTLPIDGSLGGSGQGGSLASFLVTGNNLYILAKNEIISYNISNSTNLTYTSSLRLPSLLETVYRHENYLFLGSNNAVYFLNLVDPDYPKLVSSYDHVTACDPVVARNQVAYSTIRSTNCRGIISGEDLLDAIDISDLENPQVLSSKSVTKPYGLAVNSDFLFVCENGGISVFDIETPENPSFISNTKLGEGEAYDIIPRNGYLIVVTSDGIFNVDYNQEGEFTILGEITD